ncbi:MAG: thiamine pyrophosphate-binding protein, partial [Alphaproteobacteria bacterium]|nr:thiamine pyrophosphate-binding protein [Alphaproteobacteria bacterium]
LQRVAERLDAAVATTISGQGSISERHPLAVGVVGSNGGTPETRALVDRADLVIFVGCRAGSVTTERWRHPAPGAMPVAHVDVDAATIGVNYRTEAAVVGDARLVLDALDEALGAVAPRDSGTRAAVAAARRAKAERFAALAKSDEAPIRPERLVAELQAVLPDDAVIVADPGTPCPYFSAWYEFARPGRHFISNRAHGALGYSMSAAVGAHYGRPGKTVVSVMGDGSFGFTCGELETIVRNRLPIVFVVVSNAVYGWIKAGQKTQFGQRYFSVDFSESNHARIAEAFGVKAWRVTDPNGLRAALSAALDAGGPALVDVVCQPLHEAAAPVSEWIA